MGELAAEFHFLRPWWLAALALVPLVAFLLWRAVDAVNRWRDAVDPDLLAVLIDERRQSVRHPQAWLVSAGLVMGILALAGPTWERRPDDVERQNEALVVVLDLSLSMFLEDIQPSRIERAKHKLSDILAVRREGFTGLVVYAGDAHTVTPLTDDTRTVQNLLSALTPGMMPVHGSKPEGALELARDLMTNAGMLNGRILMITDGIDRIGEVTTHAHPDFPISILGVGTKAGAPFPARIAAEIRRALEVDVSSARPALDEARLASVADVCYGRYHAITVTDEDIEYLLATPLLAPAETQTVDREFDTWHDVGYWLVIPLAFLALAAFRRGAVALVVVGLALPSDADWWDDLWQRRDQQAHAALREGRADAASELFADPAWRGVARYRGEDYDGAAAEFATQPSLDGTFNRGNALALKGDLPGAIAAYEDVLRRDSAHADAEFNKALVEAMLERQQESQGNPNQEQDKKPGEDQDQSDPQSGTDERSEDQQTGELGEENEAEPEPSADEGDRGADQKETELAEAKARERADANEQWLRKIPDDPAGLLRNKFKHETNQRLRRGELRRRTAEKVW